jgi:hypothetical protein
MKNNNPYSKYRYDNSFELHYRAFGDKVFDLFGGELKSYNDLLGNQMDQQVANAPLGVKWVVANVFTARRTSQVDTSILPTTYKGPIYFKPFKL